MADERFAALSTDPRYRFPSRKQSKTAVDPRFQGVFTDPEFTQKASVDRYGRKLKAESGKSKSGIRKLYRLDKAAKDTEQSQPGARKQDDSSSDEEDDSNEELERSNVKDPAREGGFSGSSSDSDDSSGSESDAEAELAAETAGQGQTEDVPTGEVTHRLAAVNLDWDNLQAADIFAVVSGFLPAGGRIECVTIYPSEFGRERMEYEDLHGPPKDIFAGSKEPRSDVGEEEAESDLDSEDEEENSDEAEEDDEEIKQKLLRNQVEESAEPDPAKLRKYQLERLRYYFAIITCDSSKSAKAIYDSIDSSEYSSSANIFDLRFVPDETSFEDDVPSDECTKLPAGYKPMDFKTDALVNSKVELTWDGDNRRRKEVLRQAFSGKDEDLEDLQAYLGSDDDSDTGSVASITTAKERRAARTASDKIRTRELLGLSDQPVTSGKNSKEVVGDMQITFHSGLEPRNGDTSVFENLPQDEESTRDRYIRKERDRKQKRKEKMKNAKTGDAVDDNALEEAQERGDDLGFDDPFFTDPAASAKVEKRAKKADRDKKLAAQTDEDEDKATRRAELELLMVDDQADNLKHFDMREIEKAEKAKRRKGRKDKNHKKVDGAVEDSFKVNADDPRFSKLYESHEFAIDPSNPRFKKTENMKALLEEGRRKRKANDDEVVGEKRKKGKR